ncbi:MAG TPA: DUF1573 domain-containing protein [Patescibacteria group bacterium]|nr:DUF1573 domain-containing protein [Patescibacteria group bacterium]
MKKSTHIIHILLCLLPILVVFGIVQGPRLFGKTPSVQTQAVPNNSEKTISVSELETFLQQKNVFLLDVHTPEQLHIPGTDAFLPYTDIERNQEKLPQDKSAPIVVYCRSGAMSKEAQKTLSAIGYTNVYDLEGGTDAYKGEVQVVALDPREMDLGTVIYGDVAETEFTLVNFSSSPLTVTRVSTSCGCTSARAEKETLAPYGKTKIFVSFDPAIHKDDSDLGDVTRTIYIDTDNESFSRTEASIHAIVIKNVQK